MTYEARRVKPNPDTCHRCAKRIAHDLDRYIVHEKVVLCGTCPSRHTRELHALVAPDCPIEWHDAWDHTDQLVIGCREGVAHILEKSGAHQ